MKRISQNETGSACMKVRDAKSLSPFVSGLEYGAPARGTWNIVHIGMLIPESHQVFVCAQGCLRGVVLTASEMGAMDRFSTIAVTEKDLLEGDMESMMIEGTADILNGMEKKPRAVLLFTSCIHKFVACDLGYVFDELRSRFPEIDFTDCYMTPTFRKTLSPDVLMRRQLYSLLKPCVKNERSVNIIGNALPLYDSADIVQMLRDGGYAVRDICWCKTYDEYQRMAASAANISMIPTARAGGDELERRLGQKHIYLPVCFGYDEIEAGLKTFAEAFGLAMPNTAALRGRAEEALAKAKAVIGDAPISIDYTATPRPLGLARLLSERGFNVISVYADSFVPAEQADLDWLKENAPDMLLYPTVHACMRVMERNNPGKLLAIGQKAAYFNSTRNFVNVVEGGGMHGFDGIVRMAELMTDAFDNEKDTKDIIQVKGWGCCG